MQKVSIPQFDYDRKYIGEKVVLIKNKPDHKDYCRVSRFFPGIAQGYVSDFYKLGKEVLFIELSRFYDIRQGSAVKKLRGHFIKVIH